MRNMWYACLLFTHSRKVQLYHENGAVDCWSALGQGRPQCDAQSLRRTIVYPTPVDKV